MKIQTFVIAAVVAMPLGAQWLNYPTPGIPRTADGKPNLSAPAPRTADGKPDLSGIWDMADRDGPQFLDVAHGLKGGIPYGPGTAEKVKNLAEHGRLTEQTTRCLPISIMIRHTIPTYRKIIQIPGLLVILSEYSTMYRQIFTDGRPLPTDPEPTFEGYSVGKWEGDTFVVQSAGFRDGTWLDGAANQLSSAGKITERFHRVSFGRLEIDVTVDDPTLYTRPWTVHINETLRPDTDLIDYTCGENERDIKHFVGQDASALGAK